MTPGIFFADDNIVFLNLYHFFFKCKMAFLDIITGNEELFLFCLMSNEDHISSSKANIKKA